MTKRLYSAEEAFAMLFEDSDSDSGEEVTFLMSSSSSDSSDNEPRARRPRVSDDEPQGSHTQVREESESISEWVPAVNYEPQVPEFSATPGINVDTTGFTEIDFFQLFFTNELIHLMVTQTNIYAEQIITQNPQSYIAKPHKWFPTHPTEMRKFWGLLLNMGISKKPSIRSYWNKDILYHTPLYPLTMPRARFENLLKCLHYNNNAECPPTNDPRHDRLYKIRPVVDHYNLKFGQIYTPQKCLAVDESLVHFKGRLLFRQYLPNKRARYGVKIYKACESVSGYTLRFRIYEGKDSKIEPPDCPPILGISGKIVWDLVHPLLDHGYHIYVDNFYNSIALQQSLAARGTMTCGTIRKNQRGLPKSFLDEPLRRGESRAVCSENLMLVKFKDKWDVLVLTSLHANESTPMPVRGSTERVNKPVCIQEYNQFMGGVDLSDQLMQPYSAIRKSRVWYKKIVVYLTQVALCNAFALYKVAGHTETFLGFQEIIIKKLIFGDEGEGSSSSGISRIVPGQHFPGVIPPTEKKGDHKKGVASARLEG
ncbi:piggyBac transposable element-derived protein 4-like [Engystomops pustulosus]|uniref:piggyBac transposable element-derived protein 4-like n=1 Tax=Engystomops pustulosus TaxID=76066 RepID=UPI003AFAA8E8